MSDILNIEHFVEFDNIVASLYYLGLDNLEGGRRAKIIYQHFANSKEYGWVQVLGIVFDSLIPNSHITMLDIYGYTDLSKVYVHSLVKSWLINEPNDAFGDQYDASFPYFIGALISLLSLGIPIDIGFEEVLYLAMYPNFFIGFKPWVKSVCGRMEIALINTLKISPDKRRIDIFDPLQEKYEKRFGMTIKQTVYKMYELTKKYIFTPFSNKSIFYVKKSIERRLLKNTLPCNYKSMKI
jgi:hypothetical protein